MMNGLQNNDQLGGFVTNVTVTGLRYFYSSYIQYSCPLEMNIYFKEKCHLFIDPLMISYLQYLV